jgi:uncharacterized protein with HEPN domain
VKRLLQSDICAYLRRLEVMGEAAKHILREMRGKLRYIMICYFMCSQFPKIDFSCLGKLLMTYF